MGELLEDLGLGLDVSEHATYLPEYYDGFADLLVEAIAAGWLSRNGWSTLSNKIIYAEHSKNFPMVKVEREALVDYKNVWKRLASPVLTAVARDTLFLLLHNKLPVRERLFRIGLAVDPYCEVCPGGVVCDLEKHSNPLTKLDTKIHLLHNQNQEFHHNSIISLKKIKTDKKCLHIPLLD